MYRLLKHHINRVNPHLLKISLFFDFPNNPYSVIVYNSFFFYSPNFSLQTMIFLFLMMKFGLEENEIKKKQKKNTHNLFEFFLINTYHL